MDFATIAGLAIAFVGVAGGLVWDGGEIGHFLQPAAALIVLGGTLGAVLVSFPLRVVAESARALLETLTGHLPPPEAVIDEVMAYAHRARRQGILSLERSLDAASDPLLRQGLGLVVDGQDPDSVRGVMELKVQALEERLDRAPKVLEAAGGYAPTIGVLGAVIGLIQVLQKLSSLDDVGTGIATAFVATLYGVGFANLLFLPLASKLRLRNREEVVRKEMIVEGVMAIQDKLSPGMIEDRLRSFHEVEDAAA